MKASRIRFIVDGLDPSPVSAILIKPRSASACFVFAHGAGAGMTHHFMEELATGLAKRGIATLRYQFPFMEKGSRRPDAPAAAHATVRAAVKEAKKRCRGIPLVAGGKSFGGRMASQTQAEKPLPSVAALAFIGFPLHAADSIATSRADHLAGVRVPMLFVQGDKDKLASLPAMRRVIKRLGTKAELHVIRHADHGFHVPSGQAARTAKSQTISRNFSLIGRSVSS